MLTHRNFERLSPTGAASLAQNIFWRKGQTLCDIPFSVAAHGSDTRIDE